MMVKTPRQRRGRRIYSNSRIGVLSASEAGQKRLPVEHEMENAGDDEKDAHPFMQVADSPPGMPHQQEPGDGNDKK